jgi:hypothetical protein
MSKSLQQAAEEYCRGREIEIDLDDALGHGQDGSVWKSSVPSAIKALHSWENYYRERQCYQRFAEKRIRLINGLAVPRLIGFNDSLQVIEMEIVSPPFLLDFGKAYFDCKAPYDSDQLAAWYQEMNDLWEDDYPLVCSLVFELWSRFRIHYLDVKPGNVQFRSDE